jgi:hypothetical protein
MAWRSSRRAGNTYSRPDSLRAKMKTVNEATYGLDGRSDVTPRFEMFYSETEFYCLFLYLNWHQSST